MTLSQQEKETLIFQQKYTMIVNWAIESIDNLAC